MNKFNVLVVDPAWKYDNKKTGGTTKSGSVQKYNTMSFGELQDLDDYIFPVMEENSVCFMWSTVPMLEDAIDLMFGWGYKYKTMITWVKKNYGMGYWFRGKTEHLLLGIRGKVKPFRTNIPNLIESPKVLKHSEKPLSSYLLIEHATINMEPKPKYLELFATRQFMDWTCVGYNLSQKDIKTELEEIAKKCI